MNNYNLKIAVVTDDGISVSRHFGSAPLYEVFTIENGKVAKREQLLKSGHHAPGMQHQHQQAYDNLNLAQNSSDNGHGMVGHHVHGEGHGGHNHGSMIENIMDCHFMVSRGMGWGIYNHLQNAGINPIITDISGIEDAVNAVIDGTIVNHSEKLH